MKMVIYFKAGDQIMKTVNRITIGDPSGAGPEICLKALMKDEIYRL